MFTGLIRELAKVVSFNNDILTIQSNYRPKIGDSIAINGACLTVVEFSSDTFSVQLSPESTSVLAVENYKDTVHIEPAMQMGDRFEGHIVQGHIDCVGVVSDIIDNGNSTDFYIDISKQYLKYVIPKGSIAIDGVSLTVNDIAKDGFRLTIIPHTIQNTLFKTYKIGSKVNVETDMFARYIYNMFKKDKDTLSWDQIDNIMSRY
jgi:riboflavin synthase